MKNKGPITTCIFNGKSYNVYRFTNENGKVFDLFFVRSRYQNNNTLAIEIYDTDKEPFSDATVNLLDIRQCQKGFAFFDINNNYWMKDQLLEYGLMKFAQDNYERQSGFVTYPLCEWNINLFREGGETTKYYVDYERYKDDNVYGSLSWHFEDKPETETEDLEEARQNAINCIEDFPYEEEDGVVMLYVVDENGERHFSVVNIPEEKAKELNISADKYVEVMG